MQRVLYNELSADYDKRYRQNDLPEILKKLVEICTGLHQPFVLEAGCGTGHWLRELSRYPGNYFGLDYSRGMLEQAAAGKSNITLINADANRIPLREGIFDLVFCVNAIHHFPDKKDFIHSASCLLKPGGILAIIGIDHEDPELVWYIYDYFERTREIDRSRFPSFSQMKTWMSDYRFGDIRFEKLQNIRTIRYGEEVLNDHFITKAGASQLALLSDEEYETGLDKIRTLIRTSAESGNTPAFETNLNMYLLSGIKNSR